MKKNRTLDEIRHDGLEALRERLGVEGMVRFLQQFENGSGNYASARHEWVDRVSLDDIGSVAKKLRRKPRKAG